MDLNNVPTEILRYVFRYLGCGDLITCYRVSKRWRSIVDSFGELFWKEKCAKEFNVHEESYRKSGLTWPEFYNSLSLWSNVANAEVKVTPIDIGVIKEFFVLKNNVISCVQDLIQYDNIVHYDLKSHEIIDDYETNSKINRYNEDDNICVTEYIAKKGFVLEIVYKGKNGKTKTMELFWKKNTRSWFLKNGEIFYEAFDRTTRDYQLGCIKVETDGEDAHFVKSIVIKKLNADLVDIIRKTDDELYILQIFIDSMSVMSVKNDTCRIIYDLDDAFGDVTPFLSDLGFDWSDRDIYFSIRENYPRRSFKKHKLSVPFAYGNFVITQFDDKPNYVYIFDNPYNEQRELVLHKAQPVRTIYLEGCVPQHNNKFDVIECLNGHKLIILAKHELFLVELYHKME